MIELSSLPTLPIAPFQCTQHPAKGFIQNKKATHHLGQFRPSKGGHHPYLSGPSPEIPAQLTSDVPLFPPESCHHALAVAPAVTPQRPSPHVLPLSSKFSLRSKTHSASSSSPDRLGNARSPPRALELHSSSSLVALLGGGEVGGCTAQRPDLSIQAPRSLRHQSAVSTHHCTEGRDRGRAHTQPHALTPLTPSSHIRSCPPLPSITSELRHFTGILQTPPRYDI